MKGLGRNLERRVIGDDWTRWKRSKDWEMKGRDKMKVDVRGFRGRVKQYGKARGKAKESL